MMRWCHAQILSAVSFSLLIFSSQSQSQPQTTLRPGNGNYPNIDFFFGFNEGYNLRQPSNEEVTSLICQLNLLIDRNLTSTLGNDCLTIRAESIAFAAADPGGTLSNAFPGMPLQVEFFLDGFTTDNGETEFNQEAEVLSFFQTVFDPDDFIDNYVIPLGGVWGQVDIMGFDGRARPKATSYSIDNDYECPNNPPPVVCVPTLPPDTDFVRTSAPRDQNAGARSANAPQEGLTWWVLTIIILASILLVLFCCICILAMLICARGRRSKKIVEKEVYKEVSKEKTVRRGGSDDDDSDDDDSDDDSDDDEEKAKPVKQDSVRGGAPPDDDDEPSDDDESSDDDEPPEESQTLALVPVEQKKKRLSVKKKDEDDQPANDDEPGEESQTLALTLT